MCGAAGAEVPAVAVSGLHPAAHRHQQHGRRRLLGGQQAPGHEPTARVHQHQVWRQPGVYGAGFLTYCAHFRGLEKEIWCQQVFILKYDLHTCMSLSQENLMFLAHLSWIDKLSFCDTMLSVVR